MDVGLHFVHNTGGHQGIWIVCWLDQLNVERQDGQKVNYVHSYGDEAFIYDRKRASGLQPLGMNSTKEESGIFLHFFFSDEITKMDLIVSQFCDIHR